MYMRKYQTEAPPLHIPENYAGNQFSLTDSAPVQTAVTDAPPVPGETEAEMPLPESGMPLMQAEEAIPQPPHREENVRESREPSDISPAPLSLLPEPISPDMLILLLVFLLGGEEKTAELPTLLLFLLML